MTKKEPIICDVEMYVIGKDDSLNVLETGLEDMRDARYWLQDFKTEYIYRDHFVSDMGLALIGGNNPVLGLWDDDKHWKMDDPANGRGRDK